MVHEIVLILNVKEQRRRLSRGQVKVKLLKTKRPTNENVSPHLFQHNVQENYSVYFFNELTITNKT